MKPIRALLFCCAFSLWGTLHVCADGLASSITFHSTGSIARIWNEQNLAAIRLDTPHPPVHARNLFHLSVVIYDAWAAYDPIAVGYIYKQKHLGLREKLIA